MHLKLNSYIRYVFGVRNLFEIKYILGVIDMEILLNIVIFETIT